MTMIVHLLVGALAFGGFITNALPQTPVNAGSMLIDALYAGLICMAFRSLDWRNVVRAYATWRDTTPEGCLSHRLSLLLLLVFAYFSIASALNSAYSARTSQCFVWMLVGLLLTMDKGVRKLS